LVDTQVGISVFFLRSRDFATDFFGADASAAFAKKIAAVL
jgi:hypothetical protein